MKSSLGVLLVMVSTYLECTHSIKYGCANSDGSGLKIPKGNENGASELTFEGFSIKAEKELGAFDVRVHQQNGDAGQICYSHNGGETEVEGDCPTPLDGIYIQFHPKGSRQLSKVCEFRGVGGPKCPAGQRYTKGGECIKDCPQYSRRVGNGNQCECIHGKNENYSGSCRDRPAPPSPPKITEINGQTITAGIVFLVNGGVHYQYTSKDGATAACTHSGAQLATYNQLLEAWVRGYDQCSCGWLTDGTAKFPIREHKRAGCGTPMTINDCPSTYMGQWGGPGWDAYCYKPPRHGYEPIIQKTISGGKVFHLRAGRAYAMTSREIAAAVCTNVGAQLASPEQLMEAWQSGFDNCACGWLTSGRAKFPIREKQRPKCGAAMTLNDCPNAQMGSWGGPGWDAYCFKPEFKMCLYDGKDCGGHDIRGVDNQNQQQCEQLCLNLPGCLSAQSNKENKKCWLKNFSCTLAQMSNVGSGRMLRKIPGDKPCSWWP